MYYLIHINNFLVKKDNKEYDFLYEMCQPLKEKYLKLWYLKNIYSGNDDIKQVKINNLVNEISYGLKLSEIPEYILLKSEKDKYVEVISNLEIDISSRALKKVLSEEDALAYKEALMSTSKSFFEKVLPVFEERISSKQKIK